MTVGRAFPGMLIITAKVDEGLNEVCPFPALAQLAEEH